MTQPVLVIVGGPNGSGKTTIITDPLRGRMPVINADEIARDLVRPDPRAAAYEARIMAGQSVSTFLAEKQGFAYETTLSRDDLRLATRAKQQGFRVEAYLVWTGSVELSRERVALRVARNGHNVPDDEVALRFRHAMEVLPLILGAADFAELRDNSAPGQNAPRLVALTAGGKIAHLASPPDWLAASFARWEAPLQLGEDLAPLATDPRMYHAEKMLARKRARPHDLAREAGIVRRR